MTILRSAKEPPLLRLVQQPPGHPPKMFSVPEVVCDVSRIQNLHQAGLLDTVL
jgi:hypothetical protein